MLDLSWNLIKEICSYNSNFEKKSTIFNLNNNQLKTVDFLTKYKILNHIKIK